MKKRELLVGIIMLLLVSGQPTMGQAGSKPTTAKAAEEAAQALNTRFREYADALTNRDVSALDKIWTPDYTFIDPRGQLVSKAQRIANLTSGATEFQAIKPQRESLQVLGNVAVDIGRVTLSGTKYSGQESSGEYRYMNVWRKTGSEWQMVANQITRIVK
jgi:ketosteroid isomerase-like protein